MNRTQWGRGFQPKESEAERLLANGHDGAAAARAVDEAAVEGVAHLAAQHLEQVPAARVMAGEGKLDFLRVKQNNIHRFKGSLRYQGPVVLSETLFELLRSRNPQPDSES